jgi:hypothetical protein
MAQEQAEEDSASLGQESKFQIYLSASYASQQFVETFASFANVSAGISFKKKFDISIYYGTILNDFKKQIIFPTSFSYEQNNLGLQFQYAFTDRKLRPLAGLGINYAQLAWKSEGDLDDVFTDNVFIYSGYVGGAWSIGQYFTLQGTMGYALPGEVDIIGLETEGFQGWNFNVAIKMGVFSF